MIEENNKVEEEYFLKDITTKIGSGATPRGGKSAYKTNGITLIRSLNVYDFKFKLKDLAFIDEKQAKKLNNVALEEGDILLNITGASVCRCTLVPKYLLPARVNQHVAIIRLMPSIANYLFVLYSLNNPKNKKKLLSIALTGATREALTKEDIETFKIKLPPLPQQKKIAGILSAYDDLIENNNRRIKILETMAEELYKEWFVRFRFPNYEQTSFQENGLPNGWEYVKLDKVFQLKNGKMTKRNNKGQYKVFGSNGVIGYANSYNAENSLIIGRVGVCGSVYWVTNKFWASDNSIIAIPRKEVSNIYIGYYVLRNLDMKRFAGGSAQPLLNQSTIAMLKIIKFPFALTEHFYNIVNPLFQQIQVLQQKNTFLQQERDSLLPRLLSGKLLN